MFFAELSFRSTTLVLLKSRFSAINQTGVIYYYEICKMMCIRDMWSKLAIGLSNRHFLQRLHPSTDGVTGTRSWKAHNTKNTQTLRDLFHAFLSSHPVAVLLSEKISSVATRTLGNSHNESVTSGQYDISDLIKSKM
ncbi:hypothetical protein T265_08997 [Opisthorchis viverrini]|uniref:Uncharacterized protein n=1 Tax=Opisthorchis viverrini TaxID=6198 RepID=A0A074ZIB5_OPIVI|nr:hypothetical protein T265_08997 [Opisthorchis viverrini]KER23055.1 hypothetical protein T265_08997 [Opisthorchis viverrini]